MRSLITFCRHWMLSFSIFFISASVFVPVQALHAQPIILENDHLRVELSPLFPAVDRYVLKSNNQVIYGDVELPYAYIFYEGNFYDIDLAVDNITQGGDRIFYHMKGDLASQQVVTFDLCYILSGNSVKLTFGNVQETPGYKLIVVRTPFLLTVRPDQGGAKLVFPYAEGRLIDVATTTPGHWEDCNTGGWTHAMLIAMLYHQGALAICSYDNLDVVMGWRVDDHPYKGRLGVIDIHFNYRHPPTNFELASFVDVFDEQTTSLSTKLTFLADYDQDGDIDWIDGAKFLRDQVQAVPEPRYVSSWITKRGRNGIANISQHLETIEKLYHLTDHNKIYSYLLDYGPIFSIFGVEGDLDPQWASLNELKQVFETAEKSYNTFLGFHDNYLDYYPGTPGYDPALRVVNPDGAVWDGWPLPGYDGAYKADPYEHAVQLGLERVKRTLSRYPIKESHHIDAFHFLPFKDHSLESPSSREKNRRGLKLIIDEFNKYGVDVTAEGLTGFFVGPGTGWFHDTPRILEYNLPFSGAEAIPLIEFIYHGKTLYGLFEDIYWGILPPEQVRIYTFLEPLLLGASSGSHITWSAPNDLELDKFYLIDLPWMALNQRFMEDYIVDGSYRKITYDDDTFVEIDYDSNTYTVQVDGRVIGRNYTTFFPKDENTFLIFSRDAKTLSEPLPEGWDENFTLVKLTGEGVGAGIPFQIIDRTIVFDVEANTPYKLTKTQAAPSVQSDFDGDGKTDNAIYRAASGVWWINPSGPGTPYPVGFGGHSSDIAVAGDYDADGEADIAIYRAASGVWWIRASTTGTPYPVGFGGHPSDIPAPGDYDGDGEADIAIYRAASGVWWIRPSTTGTPYPVGFGGHSSDIPAPGDYDGDGAADIAIYRAASGVWWIHPSSTGTPYAVGFGGHPSDMPVPGDYDGDGEADIAIYRAASGVWWIHPSSTGTPYAVGFGGHPSDMPVPGDYDGDGEADIAIYRSASGVWWIRPSSTGTPYAVGFGGHPSDMPVNPAVIHLY